MLKRVEAMSGTAQTIMAGDLTGRLSVIGTGDEFDRLAHNLNGMLERIESLMRGLKEVTDNIAHDLKTPLTRLRNRCEATLRSGKTEADYRRALEETIEESEGLIRTFDALLMIARAESGEVRDGMAEFDLAEVARDVSELYEPLAEDKGLMLAFEAGQPTAVKGNRELVSQALANLVDNAIKYASPEHNGAPAPGAASGQSAGHFCPGQCRSRPGRADGQRSRSGNSRRRPLARGQSFRAPGAKPLAAWFRARAQPRIGGREASRRRTQA